MLFRAKESELMQMNLEVLHKLNLKECLAFMQVLNANIADPLYVWELKDNKIYFSMDISEQFALPHKEKEGFELQELLKLTYPLDKPKMEEGIVRIATGVESEFEIEYRIIDREGKRVWVNNKGKLVNIDNGERRVVIGRCATSVFDTRVDKLTGITLGLKLRDDLQAAMEDSEQGYLFVADVDDLAAINAQKGREFGNRVLQKIASVLEKRLGQWQGIYRLSGDRFAVILQHSDREQVQDFYEAVYDDLQRFCTLSVGVAGFNDGENRNLQDILQYAETALVDAKGHGKNMINFYSTEKYNRYLSRIKLQDEIRNSIMNDCEGFFLCYQPLVDGKDFNLLGAEALLRYRSPQRGLLNPGEFIMLLEKTGMICPVGKWVLKEALKQCLEWRKVLPDFRISVNVSYVQLNQVGFEQEVLDILKELGAPGEALTLEITESMHLRDFEKYKKIFSLWKQAGIYIAVDDFGTGYSSLSYLKRLQFDVIKIDQCFVSEVTESAYNYRLISTVKELAKFSGIMICLEGIETEAQLRLLNDLQPDIYQGYLFSRPVEAHIFTVGFVDNAAGAYADYRQKVQRFTSIDVKDHLLDSSLLWNLMYDDPGYDIVHNNADNILRSLELGLWIMRIDPQTERYEMFLDKNCAEVMYASKAWSPQECYHNWFSKISPECVHYVLQMTTKMIKSGKIVQLEYNWLHPKAGTVRVRCVGIRAADSNGMITLKGYHRVISNIIQTSFLDIPNCTELL